MRWAVPLAAALVGVPVAAPPARAVTPRTPGCAIDGWSVDPDPSGLRVRAGPSAGAAVVGRLPGFVRDDDGDYGPFFLIDRAQGGWLHIRDANDSYRPSDLPRRTVYRGAGWVHNSMVRTKVQSTKGYAEPSVVSALIVDTGDDWLDLDGEVLAITACSGRWARVRYASGTTPVRGPRVGEAWFTGICGNQRTTCDFGTQTQ